MTISNEIVKFSGGNTTHYEQFSDYFNHYNKVNNQRDFGAYDEAHSLAEKSTKVNATFFSEIERLSGVAREGLSAEAWASNPSVRWAAFSVIDADTMMVLPAAINKTIGLYTDTKIVGLGDVSKVRVKPHSLYTVSRGAKGARVAFRQKKAEGNVFINPIEHIITAYGNMYEVLAGKVDIADFVTMIVLSIMADMTNEAFSALSTGMAYNTYPAQLSIEGAFSSASLITLAQTVQAYNGDAKPIIIGTAAALAKIIPDSASGFRGVWNTDGGSIRVMNDFYTFGLMEVPQVATGKSFGLALPNDTVFVISPAVNKLVYGAVSNALTNSNDFYDNADLTQNYTMRKNYDFQFVGASYGAKYKITD